MNETIEKNILSILEHFDDVDKKNIENQILSSKRTEFLSIQLLYYLCVCLEYKHEKTYAILKKMMIDDVELASNHYNLSMGTSKEQWKKIEAKYYKD